MRGLALTKLRQAANQVLSYDSMLLYSKGAPSSPPSTKEGSAAPQAPAHSGRRPRARVLAEGLRLVTEGYIRSPPLPPTLLLDRGDTPCRPPPDLR